MRDFLHPDRVVIGCDDTATAVRVSDLYRSLGAATLVTDPASAEMVKYASNAFLAAKIAFINSVANLCESVGADVREVALGMGYDKRIGFEFLKPGPGYGGSCFPKDTAALLHIAERNDVAFPLLAGVIRGNDAQYERMIDKVRTAVGGDLSSTTIAAWGLTFKANTDDLRQSPAVHVVRRLLDEGAKVRAYDPAADRTAVQAPGAGARAGRRGVRELRGRRRGGGADRVGRVPLGRLRPCGRAGRRRAPSSTAGTCSTRRSCGGAGSPTTVSAADGACRGHRRGRLRRLAPLRGAARPGLRGRRVRQLPDGPPREPLRPRAATRFLVRGAGRVPARSRWSDRSTPCCTWPARPARRSTCGCRSRR